MKEMIPIFGTIKTSVNIKPVMLLSKVRTTFAMPSDTG